MERLERFKLSEKEEGEVVFSLGDVKKSRDLCEKNLLGRIHGENDVNFTYLKQIMSKL